MRVIPGVPLLLAYIFPEVIAFVPLSSLTNEVFVSLDTAGAMTERYTSCRASQSFKIMDRPSFRLNAIRAEGSMQGEDIERRPFSSPVQSFTSLVEYLDAIDYNDGDPEYTVVLYFAHYCKLCHRANIPYKKLAYQADHRKILFTRLETSILSTTQYQSLGISRVPFVQIFRHGVCVASFNTKWQLECTLKETLAACQSRCTLDWLLFMKQFEGEIERNKIARRRLRQEVHFPSSTHSATGVIQTLASEGQLLNAVDHSDGGPMTVIMFHSHFVPGCRRAQHLYRRIAESSMASNDLVFARIESSALSETFLEALDVKKYPHIQFYKDGKCVASFSIPQTYVFRLKLWSTLDEVKQRQSKEWEIFYRQYATEIENNQHALNIYRSGHLKS